MLKWTKRIVIAGVVVLGVAFLAAKTGITSYVKTSGRMFQTAVKDSIPVEFEIQRARDLLEELIPEMQANIRIVASEEVEVANLEREIQRQKDSLRVEGDKVQKLRDMLKTQLVSYQVQGRDYQRSEVIEDLARRFEQLRTAEMLLTGKEDLLKNRKRSLDAALQKLDKTRMARVELASQIQALEAQFRLIQAQSAGSEFQLNETKLAQTNKVISDLKKRLEVAQRVLAREAKFVELVPVEPVNESSITERVDTYFARKDPTVHPARADQPSTGNLAVERR